ncbi:sigma-54 interaction domain-containing protein [Halodesulfovibrio spirochaetisodalis]|uniref:HTH-type transcriptional regulatory protein TyrR n=1 Tax=Halodesulfovibrio spirochaetisodalis TaxID=1560234 RepID=A0A1B7XDY2_9BACT|nr:sigma 54-interacting transcriptional regulator [Halodesulfovibrio spirochaetisodalis]OBQ52375.1 Fis family transcriptional regulator [Halodesulfovibrio spirochaetisodalis]
MPTSRTTLSNSPNENFFSTVLCKGEEWVIEKFTNNLRTLFPTFSQTETPKSFLNHMQQYALPADLLQLTNMPEGGTIFVKIHNVNYGVTWHWIDDSTKFRAVTIYSIADEGFQNAALHKEELDVLFESMHDGIWVIDGDGITQRVNKAMERIAGIKAEGVIGKHVSEAVEMGYTTTCVTLRALEAGHSVTMFDDYSNGVRCLNTSTPIFDANGEAWRAIACIRDISELKSLQSKLSKYELEAQVYKDKLKTLEKGQTEGVLGNSPAMLQLSQDIQRAAQVDAPVLLLGETGTGKTLTADTIHNKSGRGEGAFISINCGAIPSELLEAELFGYEPGAFSGASDKGKAGMFELADGGTLFLDEVAELPLLMQVKLLHVLDGDGYRKVGGTTQLKPNVRIIAATNKSFEQLLASGKFREDLYYRLRVLIVSIPPLRERAEDIPLLVQHFLTSANLKYNLRKTLSPDLLTTLSQNTWPGNVRELRAAVVYLVAMCDQDLITPDYLPPHFISGNDENMAAMSSATRINMKDEVETLERKLIKQALIEGKSTYKAAKLLGTSQSTIVRKAQRYKIGLVEVSHDLT